ncbi:MAG: glycosyltransferase [Candidatus Omnitrophica bacterium]|nr:glycosyltransferase [Candidatus Omnitrophota bacterium]
MKVLYVHNSLDLGGVQSVRYMFLKHLDSKVSGVDVCCLGRKGKIGEKIERLGYRVKALNEPYGLSRFSTTLKLYNYIKNNHFDIVHSALFYANYHGALAARMAGIPFLITEEHGEHYLHSGIRHFIYRVVGQKTAQRSSMVICCSDYVKQGVRRTYGLKGDNMIVLKNLIDDKRNEIKRPKEEVRSGLDIPFDAVVIGTISSLYWIKNQKILIDAVRDLNKNNLFLVMSGDGPLKDDLKNYAQKLGVGNRVRFTGPRDDVADMLNAFDIFALPSLSEGLPICLLEAMSAGLACVASRAGGITEVIEDAVTGLLFAPGDIAGLTGALKRVIDDGDLRRVLGSAARRHVLNNFKPSDYVNRVVALYKGLLGQ